MIFKFDGSNEKYVLEVKTDDYGTYIILKVYQDDCCPTYSITGDIENNIVEWYFYNKNRVSDLARNYVNKIVKLLVFA